MGLDTILEFENHGQGGCSSKRASHSNLLYLIAEMSDEEQEMLCQSCPKICEDDLGRNRFNKSLSQYRKCASSRPALVKMHDDELLMKRGSVYKSSREIKKLKKIREKCRDLGNKGSDDDFLFFEIVDVASDDRPNEQRAFTLQKRLPLTPSKPEISLVCYSTTETNRTTNTPDLSDLSIHPHPAEQAIAHSPCCDIGITEDGMIDDFLEMNLSDGDLCSSETVPFFVERSIIHSSSSNHDKGDGSDINNNVLSERCTVDASLLSSSPSEVDNGAPRTSPKPKFSPLWKMLHPFRKSNSQQKLSLLERETDKRRTTSHANIKDKALCKCLLPDFTKTVGGKGIECDELPFESDHAVDINSSPVHLSGVLKLDRCNGIPSFSFSLKGMEDTMHAKVWRSDSAFKWVYSFHHNKKKNSCSEWSMKDKHNVIGQMQVSCYLCSEVNSDGQLDNSTVMEFILYDTPQDKRSCTAEERSYCHAESIQTQNGETTESLTTTNSMESDNSVNLNKCKRPSRRAVVDSSEYDSSMSLPWTPANLLPHLEIAAVVMQFPFGKGEHLKSKKNTEDCFTEYSHSSNPSTNYNWKNRNSNSLSSVRMKVISPNGRHGLPITKGCPSSLLDRWRSRGRCDCGGWDMGCPVVVLDNDVVRNEGDCLPQESPHSFKLFVEGSKDTIPALTIRGIGEGQYSVEFHAQFSTLQAFSISVSIMHCLKSSSVDNAQELDMPMLHSNSLKLMLEEEVRRFLGAVGEKDRRKSHKAVEPIPSYYVLDPPFSPIGRV